MCLPVSRLFWVSSPAYPNLLGTKGYVVGGGGVFNASCMRPKIRVTENLENFWKLNRA
jgi:hypothetical protein